MDEDSITIDEDDVQASLKLNNEQKITYVIILKTIDTNRCASFFIDDSRETRKTFLYRALLATVRSKGIIALATATSGVAASLLLGCKTVNSRFNIPLEVNETTICNISKPSARAELIRKIKLII